MRSVYIVFFLVIFSTKLLSQNIGINTTGANPDNSAMLDVVSTTKGMLIPRMTKAQRNLIGTPADGLFVFQKDEDFGFYYFESTRNWVKGSLSAKAENVFAGEEDGWAITTGDFNTGLGKSAFNTLTEGEGNTAVGYRSLYTVETGNYNTAIGFQSMRLMNDEFNTAVGAEALYSAISGSGNTANGYQTLRSLSTGSGNTANGYQSLRANTADNNTASGYESLLLNVDGSGNTANGYQTLRSNVSGNNNTANGYQSLMANEVDNNTATGYQSLMNNSTGIQNTAVGYQTLSAITVGKGNTAAGFQALVNNEADFNTAIGASTLFSNGAGEKNTAIGYQALRSNDANSNTALGYLALTSNNTGEGNVAIGSDAVKNYTGNNVTAIGFQAGGAVVGGDNNSYLGALGDQSGGPWSNTTAVGYMAQVAGNDMVVVGNATVATIGGAVMFTVISDGRFKNNVKSDVPGLDFIKLLEPVTYNLDPMKMLKHGGRSESFIRDSSGLMDAIANKSAELKTGFIAQDVEKAAQSIGFNFSGVDTPGSDSDYYGLRYSAFVVPLVQATKEQQVLIEGLEDEVKLLNEKNESLESKIKEFEIQLQQMQKLIESKK